MSSIVISGDTSGAVTLTVPATAGTNTVTIPASTGTVMVSSNMPAFSAYQSSAQSISVGTWTKLTINTKEFDTNSNYDNATNYRFTPTVAGYYQVSGCVSLSSFNTAYVAVYKNGSIFKQGASAASYCLNAAISSLIYFNGSSDYVELYCYLGSTQNTNATQSSVYFQASMVRAA